MTSDRPPPNGKPPPGTPPLDRRAGREAKLAEALRANLRRRKAEPKARPDEPPGGESA